MLEYIIKRVVALIPVLFGITLLVFLAMHFVPGDVAQTLIGEKGGQEEVVKLRHELGLDKPLYVQYGIFLERALTGNFGVSYQTMEPATSAVMRAFPVTIQLSLVAIFFSLVIAIPAGIFAAVRQYSIFDNLLMGGAVLGISMPVFWTAVLLMMLFSLRLRWFPFTGIISNSISLHQITGFQLIDAAITGNWRAFSDVLRHLILPGIALGALPMAIIARMMRSSLLEVLQKDYVNTARAKGVRELKVINKHALRNALLPVITVVGLQFGNLLCGAILTETVFAMPGIGRLAVTSILFRDYPVVEALVLFTALAVVIVNLMVDVSYAYIDPRIRY
jgi:peptide/nickel transport system permease protein